MNNIVSIVFTGDISFDKYMSGRFDNKELLSEEIYNYLSGADHIVANIEGALFSADKEGAKTDYHHSMNPKSICALKRMNADILSIANNHIMDAGEQGLVSTLNIAKENSCRTIGAGQNILEASKPCVIKEKAGGIGIICVGYQNECIPASADTPGCFSWDDFELISKRIKEIKQKCRWCVVVSHGGEEFSPMPMPYTRDRYIKYLQMGADVVVGHHPHVSENYEVFSGGKMIFYSLGNFIFDTDYQRAHKYTDIGVLLKLKFSNNSLDFEAMGIKLLRDKGKIIPCPLPDIFTNIPAKEYQLLLPLGVKAFIKEDKRKMNFLYPLEYNDQNPDIWDSYFSDCSHEDYVKGAHMDFDILMPLAQKAQENKWKNCKLDKVKTYILSLF